MACCKGDAGPRADAPRVEFNAANFDKAGESPPFYSKLQACASPPGGQVCRLETAERAGWL